VYGKVLNTWPVRKCKTKAEISGAAPSKLILVRFCVREFY
jgi:hypothetical protein